MNRQGTEPLLREGIDIPFGPPPEESLYRCLSLFRNRRGREIPILGVGKEDLSHLHVPDY